MLIDVVLPSRQYRVFTYRVPPQWQEQVRVGSVVVVPLGTTVVKGVVVDPAESVPSSPRPGIHTQTLRELISVEIGREDHQLCPILMQLIQKIAGYYSAPLSACLPLIIPPSTVKVKTRMFLTEEGRRVLAENSVPSDADPTLRRLEGRPKGLLRTTLCRSANVKPAILDRLKKCGWVEERPVEPSATDTVLLSKEKRVMSDRLSNTTADSTGSRIRTVNEPPQGFEKITQAVNEHLFQERLCLASEESRWAGLLEAVACVFANQRRAIVLTPEIPRAESLAAQFRHRWGNRVGIFHGNLSQERKREEWVCIRKGERDVVIGTRSALFLPLPDVGLIWVDREEDASYKEEHVPYYHAREVARMRGELEQALVVYGSQIPSLEVYAQFQPDGISFVPARATPGSNVEIIDMQCVPFGKLLSPRLEEKIAQALGQRKPVILFLNRKGFSRGLLCKDCGHMPVCRVCHVTLKLFQRPSKLLCSYCGHSEPAPEQCGVCHGTVFRFTGMGTQGVEEEVTRIFPAAKVARFDREHVKTNREAHAILAAYRQGEIQILIGTEWLFHRLDPPRASLVGFPQADLGLHIPDFRSAERTFHTLFQAVEMAGQGTNPGEVILQTRMRDHHVVQAIGTQDPERFYRPELSLRDLLGYPPFAHLVLLVVAGGQASKVHLAVEFLKHKLEKLFQADITAQSTVGLGPNASFLGPIYSQKSGRRQKMRTLFLIKTGDLPAVRQRLRVLQQEYQQRFPSLPVVVETHVDPMEIN